ncbi:MAG TPA: hypothetical protein VE866_16540 [Candidatus Binatia bacterium]|nr:hypothetical protein [Candidatus Binatia bacterium]
MLAGLLRIEILVCLMTRVGRLIASTIRAALIDRVEGGRRSAPATQQVYSDYYNGYDN